MAYVWVLQYEPDFSKTHSTIYFRFNIVSYIFSAVIFQRYSVISQRLNWNEKRELDEKPWSKKGRFARPCMRVVALLPLTLKTHCEMIVAYFLAFKRTKTLFMPQQRGVVALLKNCIVKRQHKLLLCATTATAARIGSDFSQLTHTHTQEGFFVGSSRIFTFFSRTVEPAGQFRWIR